MSSATQGNQRLVEVYWLPAAIPKRTFWRRKLAALGRRLTKRLRVENLAKALEGDQEYFGM